MQNWKSEKSLTVITGHACNNHCRFCPDDRYKHIEESDVYEFLKNNVFFKRVVFSSGEPTLNPHLINYIAYAKEMGFNDIAIVSNGRRYAYRDFCVDLIDAGANEFVVSLHGYNEKIHDFLTRSPGSFRQTLGGLENIISLRNRVSKITVNHVINKVNYHHLGSFLRLLKKYPINQAVMLVVQPRGENMENNFSALMPRYKGLSRVLDKLLAEQHELFIPNEGEKREYLSILDMPFCVSEKLMPYFGFGDIRVTVKDGKKEEFSSSPYKVKGLPCQDCRYFDACGGVFANYIKKYGWKEFNSIR
jgi:cyclic pyranopterin phosphate synthase